MTSNKSNFTYMKTKLLLFFTALFISSTLIAQIWTEKATQFTASLDANHISIVDDNIIWICSADYNSSVNQFSKSIDGGNTWISGSFGLPSTFRPSSITATSGLKAWMCGYDNTTSIASVYITTDGGTTWVQQTTAFLNDPYTFPDHIHFFNDNNGIVIGDGTSSFEIYRTSNGGSIWTRVPNANLPNVISGEVTINEMQYFDYTADGSTIWLGTTYGGSANRLFKSVEYGASWTAIPLNLSGTSSYYYSFTFKNATEGYLMGKVAGVFKLQKTIDGGNTFSTITTNGLPTTITAPIIKSIPGTNTLIFTDKSSIGTYYSSDFGSAMGTNWQPFGNQTKNISSLAFNNTHTGFAGTFNQSSTIGGIYKYTNIVSLIGDALPGIAWNNDVNMSTQDGINYSLSHIYINAGYVKFRQSNTWGNNWGGAFPSDTGYNDGPNIPVSPSGYYDVAINSETGFYTFANSNGTQQQCWQSVVAGAHTLAIKTDGTLWAWGSNSFGEIGDGTTISKNTPVQIGNQTNWLSVAVGENHSLAIKSDGTLWSWGLNNYGQLGDGTFINKSIPTQITTNGNFWTTIAAGYFHSLAINSNGVLVAWGNNSDGQLGLTNTINQSIPTIVSNNFNGTWSQISAGENHTLAKCGNNLYGWGKNDYGQLGNGTYTSSSSPILIFSPTNALNQIKQIEAGRSNSFLIQQDGTLLGWGNNLYGNLGIGTHTSDNTIHTIGSNWKNISSGNNFSIGIKIDGTVLGWGANYFGQLANGTFDTSNIGIANPTQIGNDSNWLAASASKFDYSTFLKKTDNSLYSSGNNWAGQLGIGNNINQNILNMLSCLSLGITENIYSQSKLNLYPNPTSSTLTFLNPNNISIDKIIITDLTCKIVIEQTQNNNQVNVEKLSAGMYIIQAFSGEEKFQSKFIKE